MNLGSVGNICWVPEEAEAETSTEVAFKEAAPDREESDNGSGGAKGSRMSIPPPPMSIGKQFLATKNVREIETTYHLETAETVLETSPPLF